MIDAIANRCINEIPNDTESTSQVLQLPVTQDGLSSVAGDDGYRIALTICPLHDYAFSWLDKRFMFQVNTRKMMYYHNTLLCGEITLLRCKSLYAKYKSL
jgi:hypothetical protein